MSDRAESERRLELGVSQLLRAGVVISGVLLTLGWGLDARGGPWGMPLMDTGIRVLMSTPIVRVAATFVVFWQNGDRLYVIITALVLAFLAIGFFGGIHL